MAITVAGEGSVGRGGEAGPEALLLDAARGIVGRLESLVGEQIRAKALTEQRWLEDLRLFHGRYEPGVESELRNSGRSIAFVKLTRHKTNGWAARLSDLLFPTDDRNWGIQPTPLPELARAAKEAQAAAATSVDHANAAADAGQDAGARLLAEQAGAFAQVARQSDEEIAEAKRRADRMQEAIADQLVECDYSAHCRDVIEDGCRLGTGILKGPLTSNRLRAEWRARGDYWDLVQMPDPQPEFVRVDPWHFFPDMSARSISEAEYSFERSLPTRKDLRRFALKLGFNRDAVRRLLREGPGEVPGTDLNYLNNLRDITGEGEGIKGRFVMWEYHGPLECEDIAALLRASGDEEAAGAYAETRDPLEEHRVIIHFCRNEVLKIAPEYPLDSGESLYSVWNFEKGETSVFGIGIPNVMNDSQRAINGAWRMMMDNSALSVGPQIVVDQGAIMPQDGNYTLAALKVWLKTTTIIGNPNNPPFQVYNIPNNQQQLAGIIELAKAFVDEETSSPTLDQGDVGPHSQTLGRALDADELGQCGEAPGGEELGRRPHQADAEAGVRLEHAVQPRRLDQGRHAGRRARHLGSAGPRDPVDPHDEHRPELDRASGARALGQGPRHDGQEPPDPDDPAQRPALFGRGEGAEGQAGRGRRRSGHGAAAAALEKGLEAAKLESDTRLRVAEMARDQAMAELAVREKMSLADIQSRFGIKQAEIAARERVKAADIAVEERRAERARERRDSGRPRRLGLAWGDRLIRHPGEGRGVDSRLKCNSWSEKTSAGVLKPRHFRGVLL